ncbi:MAG: DNA translocase FtsK 4TM domain-containing protein, partial [Chloroflexota bacterium]
MRGAKRGRGAVPAEGARIRNEVAAIALATFALLSMVALFVDESAVILHWWRSFLFTLLGWGSIVVPLVLGTLAAEMWFGLLRRSMAASIGGALIAYTALLALLQHYQRGDPAFGDGAGGHLGSTLARLASGAFGEVGAPITLLALFLVGMVIAANRTLADLARPAWERRGRVTSLRPGASLPGGTGTRFAPGDEVDGEPPALARPEPAQPLRINLPPDRPTVPAKAPEGPEKPQLRL